MTTARHIHLDLLGGIAGDMFAAAMLDAVPSLRPGLAKALDIDGLTSLARLTWKTSTSAGIAGLQVSVVPTRPAAEQHHRSYRDIMGILAGLPLDHAVRARAEAVFTLLADAEAGIHGVDRASVVFHEVGAVDSIFDIIAGAWLIEAVGDAAWSCSPIPLGSGRVKTDHGPLPVPAPATALLLEGMPTFTDGLAGERVTPTGAALLRSLDPSFEPPEQVMTLAATGHGLGSRSLDGMANLLRVVVFDEISVCGHDNILVCTFEVDDQTPEDLALALDRMRSLAGVIDVLQVPAIGKRGRMCTHIQVLATPGRLEPVVETIFRETTTLGLRWQRVARRTLARETVRIGDGDATVDVKLANRPGGTTTAKAEMADLADVSGGHDGRRVARARAEAAARDRGEAGDG
ncbi:MAG: LarC family nickel insertion protein [Pseudomonadota bacterium]